MNTFEKFHVFLLQEKFACLYMRLCYRIQCMEKINDKRGRYMDLWTPEKKKEYMSNLARKKWENMSVADRKKIGKRLALSRKAIIS